MFDWTAVVEGRRVGNMGSGADPADDRADTRSPSGEAVMATRNKIATTKREGDLIVFTFATGEQRTIDPLRMPTRDAFTFHGAEQKLRDEYAGAESVGEAIAAFDALYERLAAGEWTKRRESAGPRLTLREAVARVYSDWAGVGLDDARAIIKGEKPDRKGRTWNRKIFDNFRGLEDISPLVAESMAPKADAEPALGADDV